MLAVNARNGCFSLSVPRAQGGDDLAILIHDSHVPTKEHEVARLGIFLGEKVEFAGLAKLRRGTEAVRHASALIDFVHEMRTIGFFLYPFARAWASSVLSGGKVFGRGNLEDEVPASFIEGNAAWR